ncbi:hypothetical protein [Flavobacterium lacisediminis]|uniref:Uncharacterized protein n=1 Tax=Flavobacterium lacisediminis TaxID=2989705 RepID=A0ABT3EIH7_9FLAO|nr:hypothetical protein [Flavobacterium lacisediminis]MCW1148362.1 hypothetical protein [Flavobacterium lacisediminis]
MTKDTPIINILTYQLPYNLANQIYNEYQSRLKETNYLIENYKTYKSLRDSSRTIELLLSLSIFHRRVITNLDGAVKFYGTVTKKGKTDTIRIGSYDLTFEEKNKILAVVINFNHLLERFSIPPIVMEYHETREFLKKIITLKSELQNGNKEKREGNKNNEEDIPF